MTESRSNTTLRDQLVSIYKQVSKHFTVKADRGEQWDMPPENYDGSQAISDDCDGFCLACRVLLRRAGLASRLVYCEVNYGGHLVVEVQGWIFCNLQRTVVPNTYLKDYRWLRISGYEPGDQWHEINAN